MAAPKIIFSARGRMTRVGPMVWLERLAAKDSATDKKQHTREREIARLERRIELERELISDFHLRDRANYEDYGIRNTKKEWRAFVAIDNAMERKIRQCEKRIVKLKTGLNATCA